MTGARYRMRGLVDERAAPVSDRRTLLLGAGLLAVDRLGARGSPRRSSAINWTGTSSRTN